MASNEQIFFIERDTFMGLLENAIAAEQVSVIEPLVKRMCDIITKYQEQPHLLDPHLEAIVYPVMSRIRRTLRIWHEERTTTQLLINSQNTSTNTTSSSHTAFSTQVYHNPIVHQLLVLIYILCKTRGYKHIIKLFPHEVADVEPCVQAIVCQDNTSHETWETRYVLLLWLSILVLIPFDLTTVDSTVITLPSSSSSSSSSSINEGNRKNTNPSSTTTSTTGGGLINTILQICKSYLSDPGVVRDASAVCLARLLTRPDMDRSHLRSYTSWAADTLALCTAKITNENEDDLGPEDEQDITVNSNIRGSNTEGDIDNLSSSNTASNKLSVTNTTSIASRIFLATGVLTSLVNIAKFGHRDVLLDILGDVFSRVNAIAASETTVGRGAAAHRNTSLKASPLLRKLTVKLAARTGLTHLPPRIVTWRYSRGSRSLLENLSLAGVTAAKERSSNVTVITSASSLNSKTGLLQSGNIGLHDPSVSLTSSSSPKKMNPSNSSSSLNDDENDDNNIEIPPEMEDIIDMLLQGLRDTDTVVRWSAAKGIGRVTGRLPQDFADDVVLAVLQLLNSTEGDGAWHGGCLALAELARRGLLLPSRLPEVVPFVLQALQYDIRRGSHSVGQHVRDAACYVCWAFARAYAPSVMHPHVLELARGMLITALFDREVNCRRAASAAFQENVGRQGHENFPNGIAILTAADYFTLGNRTNAYLSVAPIVATYSQYRHALFTHLLDTKLKHWDKDVRELSAKALARMTKLDPQWAIDIAIPKLLPLTTSPDLSIRHGATLGIAELVLALAQVSIHGRIPTLLQDEIRNIVVKAEKMRVYTGRGGEIVRAAMCRLIECQCLANHSLSRKAALRLLQTVEECLKHPNDQIQAYAVAALRALTAHALGEPEPAVLDRVTRTFVKHMSDENPAVRRGAALALGALPRTLVVGDDLDKVIQALCRATQPEKQSYKRDAEARRNAAIALGDLVMTVGYGKMKKVTNPLSILTVTDEPVVYSNGLSTTQIAKIMDVLLDATRDYATDNRGDVGSWVRKAALEALEKILVLLQMHAWRAKVFQQALVILTSSSSSITAIHQAVEDIHIIVGNDPLSAIGGIPATIEALQHSSGYGNITGYEAGARLLGANLPRVNSTVSRVSVYRSSASTLSRDTVIGKPGGIQVGHSVQTPYGPGVLLNVTAAGLICEVAFPELSIGSILFPYGSGLLDSENVYPSSVPVSLTKDTSPSALLVARLRYQKIWYVPAEDTGEQHFFTNFITEKMLSSTICAFLRQVGEKLDLLRAVAGDSLCRLLHLPKPLPNFTSLPHRERLVDVFPESAWGNTSTVVKSGTEEDFGEEDAGTNDDNEDKAQDTEATTSSKPSTENKVSGSVVQWAIPHQCFPRIAGLLGTKEYTNALIEGFVTSVGGLSESVVKYSANALSLWASEAKRQQQTMDLQVVGEALVTLIQPRPRLAWELNTDENGGSSNGSNSGSSAHTNGSDGFDPSLQRWFKEILGSSSGTVTGGRLPSSASNAVAASSSVSTSNVKSSSVDINTTHRVDVRIIVPALRTMEVLLSKGAFDSLVPPQSTWSTEVLVLIKRRVSMAKEDVARVLAAGAVYLGLLHFPLAIRESSLTNLLDLLGHPFPRVRKTISEKLYIRLLTVDEAILAENLETVMSLLTETSWDAPLDVVVIARDKLYSLLQISMPDNRMGISIDDQNLAKGVQANGTEGGGGSDEYTSYGALARDAGY